MAGDPAPHIIICGAGLAGLTLAHILKKHSIPFHLYERDAATGFRAQGYRIYLHGPGIDALRYALSPKQFALFDQTCAKISYGWVQEADPMTAEKAESHIWLGNAPDSKDPEPEPKGGHHPPPLRDRRTADRAVLRDVLLVGLEDHVSYGREMIQYETDGSSVTVHFKDGSSATGSMLVGAEGVGSPVRSQLLASHRPKYTGCLVFYGKSKWTEDLQQTVGDRMLGGMSFIRDQKTEVPSFNLIEPIHFTKNSRPDHPMLPDDYVYWISVVQEKHLNMKQDQLRVIKSEDAAKMVIDLHKHWHPSLRAVYEAQDVSQTSVLVLRCSDPSIPDWEPSSTVTVLGDSIHAMPPTGASGAVTALRDAALLGKLIVEKGAGQDTIRAYEEEMRGYARETVDMSVKAGRFSFGYGPPESWQDV